MKKPIEVNASDERIAELRALGANVTKAKTRPDVAKSKPKKEAEAVPEPIPAQESSE